MTSDKRKTALRLSYYIVMTAAGVGILIAAQQHPEWSGAISVGAAGIVAIITIALDVLGILRGGERVAE